jgi:hypothetical protein
MNAVRDGKRISIFRRYEENGLLSDPAWPFWQGRARVFKNYIAHPDFVPTAPDTPQVILETLDDHGAAHHQLGAHEAGKAKSKKRPLGQAMKTPKDQSPTHQELFARVCLVKDPARSGRGGFEF